MALAHPRTSDDDPPVHRSSDAPTGSSVDPSVEGAGRAGVFSGVLPSVAAALCLLLLMAAVTAHAASPLRNMDTWFHLRIGHELWDGWSLSQPGQLSSFATSPWLPTQWSTEMLAARMEDWFGLPGVAWLFGALFLGFIVATYLCCRAQSSPVPAVVATGLVVLASSPALSARPQVVSLALLAVVVGSWLRCGRDLRVPWHLVPLTWLWATAHGLWSSGVIVGAVCVVGILLDRRPDRRTSLAMVAVPVLSAVAAALTPVGPALLTSQGVVGARASLIGEWGPTSFREVAAFAVAVMIGVVVMRWGRSREVPWTHLLLLVLACGWTALVTRMVASGAVVVAPIFAGVLQQLLRSGWRPPKRVEFSLLAVAVTVMLAGLGVNAPRSAARPGGVPSGFASRLAALPAGAPVAVEGGVGAWIEYRFPRLNPIIDGMFDAYPVSYIKDYTDFRAVRPGWTGFLRDSGAKVAVTQRGSSLTAAMEHQLQWRVADTEGRYVYLVAPESTG